MKKSKMSLILQIYINTLIKAGGLGDDFIGKNAEAKKFSKL